MYTITVINRNEKVTFTYDDLEEARINEWQLIMFYQYCPDVKIESNF